MVAWTDQLIQDEFFTSFEPVSWFPGLFFLGTRHAARLNDTNESYARILEPVFWWGQAAEWIGCFSCAQAVRGSARVPWEYRERLLGPSRGQVRESFLEGRGLRQILDGERGLARWRKEKRVCQVGKCYQRQLLRPCCWNTTGYRAALLCLQTACEACVRVVYFGREFTLLFFFCCILPGKL